MEIPLHSVIITVGPSGCGKSFFTKTILKPELERQLTEKGIVPKVGYISSDECRMELLGGVRDRFAKDMLEVSGKAFALLRFKLELMTSYSAMNHFIIVDSTGLNEDFRNDLIELVSRKKYTPVLTVFNYSIENYFKFAPNRKVTKYHIDKFRDSLKAMGKGKYKRINITKHVDPKEFPITISNLDEYARCQLPRDCSYFIIGDLHECYDELILLLKKAKFEIEKDIVVPRKDIKIVFIGDWLDKSFEEERTRNTVEFLYNNYMENPDSFVLIRGNHEKTVYNLLTGKSKESAFPREMIDRHYSSYRVLQKYKDLAEKFITLYENTIPFGYYHSPDSNSNSFYLSHSPAGCKHVGKLDKDSIRNQVYMAWSDRDSVRGSFWFKMGYKKEGDKFIKDSARRGEPYHIFGHVAIDKYYFGPRYGTNSIFIDTGCAMGNRLTGIWMGKGIDRPKMFNILAARNYFGTEGKLEDITVPPKEPTETRLLNVSSHSRHIINQAHLRNVYFRSGTVSPADKDGSDLESLKKAIEYYWYYVTEKKLDTRLILQPKYMGSRCQMYLSNNMEETKLVSRKGFSIDIPDEDRIRISKETYKRVMLFMETYAIDSMIIDGELMPWSAIGKDLIDKQFGTIETGLRTELELDIESGFDESLMELVEKMKKEEFNPKMSKKEKKDIHGFMATTYQTLTEYYEEHAPVDVRTKEVETYSEQLKIYGSEGEIHYKPFSILKVVYKSGKENVLGVEGIKTDIPDFGQVSMFELLTDDPCLVLNPAEPILSNLAVAQEFFDKLTTERRMEGVMIKLDFIPLTHAPMIKVRNMDYLTIIYGPDFRRKKKLEKLIAKKNIRRKRELSIREFGLE